VDRIKSFFGRERARQEAINTALEDAKVNPRDIDYISLDGLAVEIWDDSEDQCAQDSFWGCFTGIPASVRRACLVSAGASGALDMIIAILSMEHGLFPRP
jgi:act minimal PKS ketosynthase (KS/KS alpha)